METFSAVLAICAGNSPVSGEFPTQRPVTRSFDVFFICVWINGWVNNGEAGDLRRYRAHYDVTVMLYMSVLRVLIYWYAKSIHWSFQWWVCSHFNTLKPSFSNPCFCGKMNCCVLIPVLGGMYSDICIYSDGNLCHIKKIMKNSSIVTLCGFATPRCWLGCLEFVKMYLLTPIWTLTWLCAYL